MMTWEPLPPPMLRNISKDRRMTATVSTASCLAIVPSCVLQCCNEFTPQLKVVKSFELVFVSILQGDVGLLFYSNRAGTGAPLCFFGGSSHGRHNVVGSRFCRFCAVVSSDVNFENSALRRTDHHGCKKI